jgi:hypothetical protein
MVRNGRPSSGRDCAKAVRDKLKAAAAKLAARRPVNRPRRVGPNLHHVIVPSTAAGADCRRDGRRGSLANVSASKHAELDEEFVRLNGYDEGPDVSEGLVGKI